jgi:N-methylhydantoinase A
MAATAQRGASASASAGGKLINIDNGGTLTDICVIEGERVWRTKTLTTPYDLSECLFTGLRKASKVIYGREDLLTLLLSTDYIRYSTTQGTNALIERKGPRLGLILSGNLRAADLQSDDASKEMFTALVGERVATIASDQVGDALETATVRAINALAAAGANRVVVACGGDGREHNEAQLKRVLLRKFPPHLLGAIPVLYSHEVAGDANDVRRTWTALFNAFLHPAMERFLYTAEHKLRELKTRNPLLIFRNDGQSARVAKTIAVKTYSSGPRGGAEGAKALAQHYGFKNLLSMDVGGTTTDIVVVDNGVVRAEARGHIEGVATSFPLCKVVSVGVGGSSIIRTEGGTISVGPQSVGSAPGPACFGLGGKEATITDAFLALGLLDPVSYFGGELKIDRERARAAITDRIAQPLKLDIEAAAEAMENAWVAKIADNLKRYTTISADTALAAFGGGGPLVACKVANAADISKVVIPGLAAVFSAFGIGFSDIGHEYQAPLGSSDDAALGTFA